MREWKCCLGWLCLAVLTWGLASPLAAEDAGEEDLLELASEAADGEVAAADEVLAEEERRHGAEWWTRGKLVWMAGIWGAAQLGLVLWVGRDVRRRGRRWPAVLGWVCGVAVLGPAAALVYWWSGRGRTGVNNPVAGND